MSGLGILGKLITQGTKQINPGALPKNLQRAQSQGYDVDNKLYHATNADKIDEFRTDLIGSNTDEGFMVKGFTFPHIKVRLVTMVKMLENMSLEATC